MGGSPVAIQLSIADRMGHGLEQLRTAVLDPLLFASICKEDTWESQTVLYTTCGAHPVLPWQSPENTGLVPG